MTAKRKQIGTSKEETKRIGTTKGTTKRADVGDEYFVQYGDMEINVKEIATEIKKIAKGGNLHLYIKPQERKVYYVTDDEVGDMDI
ncbi:MAG: hypothetical protein HDT39_10045 [Lachnospiraceae bacterium]|nr:hypothetical protein [Lachnospiraceae bacterium]